MELTGRGEVSRPPVGLRPPHRQIGLHRGINSQDAVEHPLLRRRQRIPADPLRHRPGSEVLALHDHLARPHGQRSAGTQVGEGEVEAALPVDAPGGAPGRIDRVQCLLAAL
ncbi:hypothetical protein [Streptomyces sp. OV198]|uniref:hypothetical protein n=1 Tax=Streptomyces sp. OV198 TaxID=1882787 RepID=UPI0015CF2308|nr:hypothetical protein [Streptomyces sp. OV198]